MPAQTMSKVCLYWVVIHAECSVHVNQPAHCSLHTDQAIKHSLMASSDLRFSVT